MISERIKQLVNYGAEKNLITEAFSYMTPG